VVASVADVYCCFLSFFAVGQFTEVGFHGRDVDEMVRELVEAAMVLTKKRWKKIKKKEVASSVEKKILQSLLGGEEDAQTRKAMTQFYR